MSAIQSKTRANKLSGRNSESKHLISPHNNLQVLSFKSESQQSEKQEYSTGDMARAIWIIEVEVLGITQNGLASKAKDLQFMVGLELSDSFI